MKKFIILIPLFNDWKSVSKLLSEIDCKKLNSQKIEKYKIYAYRKNKKELRPNSILEVPKSYIK